jgi:hypothetical protein
MGPRLYRYMHIGTEKTSQWERDTLFMNLFVDEMNFR